MSDKGESASKREEPDTEAQPAINWLEKVATVISGLLLLVIVAVLAWDGLRENRPAALTAISAGVGEVRGESWYVPVGVHNAGDEAVRDVVIAVEVTVDGRTEEGTFTVDWLPGRSRREGVAVLPKATVGHPLKATVKGYLLP